MNRVARHFGDTEKKEATKEQKIALTGNAKHLNAQSQTAETIQRIGGPGALEALVRANMTQIDGLVMFEESGILDWGSWDSSQTIRANLQATINNIRVNTGTREGTVHGQQRDVSVATETVSNIASKEFVRR